jgi:hypothetical protein
MRVSDNTSTYLQLGEDGEKASEPWRLAGGTGGGEGGDQEGLQLGQGSGKELLTCH